MNDLATLEALVKTHGLRMRECSPGHWQVKGAVLVNWYPNSKRKAMYVAGTTTAASNATPRQVVEAAMGTALPKITRERRKKSYTSAKRRLYAMSQCCHWCKRPLTFEAGTVDHVIPLSRGGLNNMNNYVLACQPCNNGRANSIPKLEAVTP